MSAKSYTYYLSLFFLICLSYTYPIYTSEGSYNDFDKNPYISKDARKSIKPYLLPKNHPAKIGLDEIFTTTRAIQNDDTFIQAGFNIIERTGRSFLLVASHPLLNGYLVKVALDSEFRQKNDKPSWLWFVRRCKGSETIAKIIAKKKITNFTVSKKWIYPLPINPSPPSNTQYDRKIAILLVTDMNLVSHIENLDAWKTKITKKHLDELYVIISQGGSSYRPDNIWYTKNGTFAFIDTEYPNADPDYGSVRPFLSSSMLTYWDKLIRHGSK